jgi:LysR family glycine cleavage system transcriptional activator
VVASQLLARDLLQRGVLTAPFEMSLPGARDYLVTTEENAQRANIMKLRDWLLRQIAPG